MITLCPKWCCQKICKEVKASQNQLHQRQVQNQSPSKRKNEVTYLQSRLGLLHLEIPSQGIFCSQSARDSYSKWQNVKILCLLVNKLSNVKSIETGLTCSRLARCQSFFQEWIQQHWTSVQVLWKINVKGYHGILSLRNCQPVENESRRMNSSKIRLPDPNILLSDRVT